MGDYTLVTANIRSNPLQSEADVASRIAQALNLCGAGGAAFLQEMAPSNARARSMYRRRMAAAAKARSYTYRAQNSETPVLLGYRVWLIQGATWTLLPKSWRKHVSPARGYTVVRAVRDGMPHAFINVHPVSKGYAGARKRASVWSWRNAQLNAYQSAVARATAKLNAAGYTVNVAGDHNDPNPPLPHPRARKLVHSGLDHVWVIPAPGHVVRNVTTTSVAATKAMDHPILVASYNLEKIG